MNTEDVPCQCRNRSNSNHRCCYDFRYRGADTRRFSESSSSSSLCSSSSSNKRKSPRTEKHESSGYGCSLPKIQKVEHPPKRYFCHMVELKFLIICFDSIFVLVLILPSRALVFVSGAGAGLVHTMVPPLSRDGMTRSISQYNISMAIVREAWEFVFVTASMGPGLSTRRSTSSGVRAAI